MKKHFCAILLFILLMLQITSGLAQVPADFDRIECAGDMPEDFSSLFSSKVEIDMSANRQVAGLTKKESREFAAMTNFYTDNLIRSGKVLYGDSMTALCQKIADTLSSYTELERPIRVYTIKTNQVNAYSTHQGIVFVTIGLLARLENEAQLAFILAHEMGHVAKQHSLEAYHDKNDLIKGRKAYRHLNMEDRMLESYRHSRQSEEEADRFGIELFQKAGYDPRICNSTFDILLRGYLPIAEKDVPWEKFETNGFKIPAKYRLDEDKYNDIELEEDIDDSQLTHPNIKKRKEIVQEMLNDMSFESDTGMYVFSTASSFKTMRDIARFEMINIYLRNSWYPLAYYTADILMQEYPNHQFLKEAAIMSWAGMQIFINNSQKREYSNGYTDYEGRQQGMLFWTYRINRKEVNAIATKYVWENADEIEDSTLAEALKHQSLKELVSRSGLSNKFFIRGYELDENGDTIVEQATTRSRRRRKHAYCNTAFLGLFQNDAFAKTFDNYFEDFQTDEEDEYDDEDFDTESSDYDEGFSDSYSYHGVRNVDKLLMITPRFFKLDLRKSIDRSVLNSDVEQNRLNDDLKDVSDQLDVEVVVLDDRTDDQFSTEKFNDYSQLSEWLMEESNYDGLDFYSFRSRNLNEMRERYDTDYLGTNSVWTVRYRKPFNFWNFLIFAVITSAYGIPFYLIWQLTPLHETEYTFNLYDLNSGNPVYVDYLHFPGKYRKDLINAHLYNSINQLSQP